MQMRDFFRSNAMYHRLNIPWNFIDRGMIAQFNCLNDDVTMLDLSRNDLGFKSTTTLIQAFSYIPQSVDVIDLSKNSFDEKSDDEFRKILNAIPETVTSIKFQFFEVKSMNKGRRADLRKRFLGSDGIIFVDGAGSVMAPTGSIENHNRLTRARIKPFSFPSLQNLSAFYVSKNFSGNEYSEEDISFDVIQQVQYYRKQV
jgi:hypothetical protein